MKRLLIVVGFISLVICGENSVTINVKNVVNKVSDKFISYELDFYDLMQEKTLDSLRSSSPAYIKLRGFLSYLKSEEDNNKKFNETDVASMFKALNSFQLVPVIVIDYDANSFEPLILLESLRQVRNLKVNKCIWQLGNNTIRSFDSAVLKKYSEDLKTLKVLCESVNREHNLDWNIAADSLLLLNQAVNMPFEVVGYDLSNLSPIDVLTRSNVVSSKIYAPTWITLDSAVGDESSPLNKETCGDECLMNGLMYAQVIGEAAKKGFDVLFFDQLTNSSTFEHAVISLHKKLVGSKVFNVRVSKSTKDGKQMSLYSHCSKKADGSITLMGINFSNLRSKFNARILSPIDANGVILQYLLSASDGHVLLNNEKFNVDATPSHKFKKLSKYSIPLALPPFSMAFWIIKGAKVDECIDEQSFQVDAKESRQTSQSSSDQLLLKLVANEFGEKRSNALEKIVRPKRQLGATNSFLPTFELDFPFKLSSNNRLPSTTSAFNPLKDVFFPKPADTLNLAQPEPTHILVSSENPSLPKGDVYMRISDGKRVVGSASIDYVADDDTQQSLRQKISRKKSGNKITTTTEAAPDYFIPYDYIDASKKSSKKSPKKSSKQEKPREIGELFEVEQDSSSKVRHGDSMRSPTNNVELKTVIRELEPTYRQSKSALSAAKQKWNRQRIMELLKDATLEDVEKLEISDDDEFDVIDLTENDNVEMANYEEYDVDDDGFFGDDLHHVRTKRNVDYARNEIPKYGSHLMMYDDDDSIESLIEDVHLFLPPRVVSTEERSTEATTRLPVTTDPPTAVKAIEFFTQSLNNAVNVAHKTLVGWWYVFNPVEYY